MAERPVLDLIVEDEAQELFIGAIVRRIATECERPVTLHILSARGGRPQVFRILANYETITGELPRRAADLVVVAVDGNGQSFAATRGTVLEQAPTVLASRIVVACPEPYIERWFVADQESVHRVIGAAPTPRARGRRREDYKALLLRTVRAAGFSPAAGGAEFAVEIVKEMDLYRAGKNQSSLKAFIDDLRGFLRRVSST